MKKITFINISFFILFLGIGMKNLSAQINPVLREKLRVYYVANPNAEGNPHMVEVTASGSIFGGNENMQLSEEFVRSIFFENEQHTEFQDSIVSILSTLRRPVAFFLHDDINELNDDVSVRWNNCII